MSAKAQAVQDAAFTPPIHDGVLQRKCACGQHTVAGGECDQCNKDREAPPQVDRALSEPGEPLDEDMRDFLEPRMEQDLSHIPARLSAKAAGPLTVSRAGDPAEAAADAASDRALAEPAPAKNAGADLRGVRVHTGARAAEAAESVSARAFTVGNHVFFNAGEYRPQTLSGRRLLAHEIAHVLQQAGAKAPAGRVLRKVQNGKDPNASPTAKDDDRKAAPSALPDQDKEPPERGDVAKQPTPGVPKPPPDDTAQAGDKAKAVDAQAKQLAGKLPAGPEADKAKDPEGFADISTSGIALIDEELAEHERWGAASALVGTAGSVERAAFIADEAAGGLASGFGKGLVQGAATAGAIKVTEKLVEKGALKLAARFAPQVTKFTPLPAVGAVIGGVMAAYDLASRDWKATGETIGHFGQGSDEYEKLANSLESISTVLEIVSSVLNVIAGIIGGIAIASWAIAIVTLGVASPLSVTLSSIAVGIGLATLALDAINSLLIKPTIAMFRALHTFTSEADPRDVVTQGDAIAAAAGAAGGFLGGLAGAKAVEHGVHLAQPKKGTPAPDHPNPPAKAGDGPTLKVEAPETKAGGPDTPAVNAPADTKAPAVETKPTIEVKAVEPKQAVESKPPADTPPSGETKPAAEGKTPTPPDKPVEIKPGVVKRKRTPPAEPVAKPLETTADTAEGSGEKGERKASPPEKKRSTSEEIQQSIQEDIDKHGGNQVDKEFIENLPPEKREGALTDKDKIPGRSEVPKEVQSWLRRKARAEFGKVMQAALKGNAEHTELTRLTESTLSEGDKRYIIKNGKLPPHIEFHHLMAVADFPEWAMRYEVGLGLPKYEHIAAGHGGNTKTPLETLTLLNPKALENPGFDIDPRSVEAQKTNAPASSTAGELNPGEADAAKQASQDHGIKIQIGKQIAAFNRELATLDASKPKDAARIRVIQKHLAELNSSQAALRNNPPAAPPVTTAPPAPPEPAVTPTPVPAKPAIQDATPPPAPSPEHSPTPAPGAKASTDQPVPAPQPTAAPQPGEPHTEPPKIRVATPEPEPPKVRVATPEDAGHQALQEQHAEAENEPPPAKGLQMLHPGSVIRSIKDMESVKQLGKNVKAMSAMDPRKMTAGELAAGALGGPLAALATRDINAGIAKAKAEPVIEHVNPNYPAPPCSPQDIVTVENHILDTLAERARMEDAAKKTAAQEKHHKENEQPLTEMQKGTADALSATEAHKQAIQRRGDANDNSQKKEGEVKTSLESYEERASELNRLKFLLKGFERFTSLAYSLPDEPGILVGAKRSIIRMNTDAKKFLTRMDEVETTMTAQKSAQAERKKKLEADSGKIKDTDKKAAQSNDTLDGAKTDAQDFDTDNKAHLDDAAKLKNTSNQIAGQLGTHANQKKAQAQSMASDLQTWAQNHKQARTDALESTKQKYLKQGYKILEVKEL